MGFRSRFRRFRSRLRRGWHIGTTSVGVLLAQPRLLVFPVAGLLVLAALGGLAVLGVTRGPAGPAAAAVADLGLPARAAVGLLALFATSAVATAVWTFFAAALVHFAATVFRGGTPTLRGSLATAWRARRKILAWALVAATAAVVVRVLESWDVGEQLVRSAFGFTWAVLTFFVVPVLVLEDHGVRESVRESGRTFVETWGETASATVGATVVLVAGMLAATAALSVGFVLAAGSPTALAALTIVLFGFFLLQVPAALTLGAVVKTALYLYAREDEVPPAFADVDVVGAVE